MYSWLIAMQARIAHTQKQFLFVYVCVVMFFMLDLIIYISYYRCCFKRSLRQTAFFCFWIKQEIVVLSCITSHSLWMHWSSTANFHMHLSRIEPKESHIPVVHFFLAKWRRIKMRIRAIFFLPRLLTANDTEGIKKKMYVCMIFFFNCLTPSFLFIIWLSPLLIPPVLLLPSCVIFYFYFSTIAWFLYQACTHLHFLEYHLRCLTIVAVVWCSLTLPLSSWLSI